MQNNTRLCSVGGIQKMKVKCPYCGREMKAAKEMPLMSYCEGGLFRKHDTIQWTLIDNSFQTKNGKMVSELAKKGYEVRRHGQQGFFEIVRK
jgi:hypothetical protein